MTEGWTWTTRAVPGDVPAGLPRHPVAELRAEVERLRAACARTEHEVQQVLGKALGYPRFGDDPKNFPDATEADGVCVGEHVAGSLAAEAAERIGRLTRELRQAAAHALTLDTQLDANYEARLAAEAERDRLRAERDAIADAYIEHHPEQAFGDLTLAECWRVVMPHRPEPNRVNIDWRPFPSLGAARAAIRQAAGLDPEPAP